MEAVHGDQRHYVDDQASLRLEVAFRELLAEAEKHGIVRRRDTLEVGHSLRSAEDTYEACAHVFGGVRTKELPKCAR